LAEHLATEEIAICKTGPKLVLVIDLPLPLITKGIGEIISSSTVHTADFRRHREVSPGLVFPDRRGVIETLSFVLVFIGGLLTGVVLTVAFFLFWIQELRMVYRLLLLLVAEEKKDENGQNLLHPPDTADQVRRRYAQYYSVGRFRTLAGKRRGTTHTDLYESLKLLFLKLRTGYEPLGIPGLGSFLFSPTATPVLPRRPVGHTPIERRSTPDLP
jgi:hypothetical protein